MKNQPLFARRILEKKVGTTVFQLLDYQKNENIGNSEDEAAVAAYKMCIVANFHPSIE